LCQYQKVKKKYIKFDNELTPKKRSIYRKVLFSCKSETIPKKKTKLLCLSYYGFSCETKKCFFMFIFYTSTNWSGWVFMFGGYSDIFWDAQDLKLLYKYHKKWGYVWFKSFEQNFHPLSMMTCLLSNQMSISRPKI
jgi:hypothetical protein